MTSVQYTGEESEVIEALIGWALDEDHASVAPGWLDERLGIDGAAAVLQLAIGKASGGVTAGDALEVAEDDSEAVFVVITPNPTKSPEQWDVEILDSRPKWNTFDQIVRAGNVNGGDTVPVHPEPGTAYRADITVRLAQAFGISVENKDLGTEKAMLDVFSVVHGIINEYRDGGDQMVESFCICYVDGGGHRVVNPACPEHRHEA